MDSKFKIWHSRALSGLVLAGALTALGPSDLWAQAASNVNCNKCVDTDDIAKKAVEKKQLAKDSVSSNRIKDGAVTEAKIADGAVSGAKIADGAVDVADLSPSALQLITDLEAQVAALEARVAALESAPLAALSPFVTVDVVPVDLDGDGLPEMLPRVLFEGINLQIANGEGQTHAPSNGLGNLIVGYNERRTAGDEVCSDGAIDNRTACENAGEVWALNHKSGSHNLVVGSGNAYSRSGGVVFGADNAVTGRGAAVTGGSENEARGRLASVTGGHRNEASGSESSVSGGSGNRASGATSSVSGGELNTASEDFASVSAGLDNHASGSRAGVSGGDNTTIAANCNWGGEDLVLGDGVCSPP